MVADDGKVTVDPSDELDPRVLARQMVLGVALMMAALGLLALVAKDPLEAASAWFVARFGLVGLFFGVLLVDATVFTNEPFLFLGYEGGLGFWPVYIAAASASVLAGPTGWAMGRLISGNAWLQGQIKKRKIDIFFQRYGFWAVAVAAVTPIPYSLVTWASGAARLPLLTVFLGSLFRIPKTMFYYLLIVYGWDVFTGEAA